MLARSFGGGVELYFAEDERTPPSGASRSEWATAPAQAPKAWPSGFAGTGGGDGSRAPVTGQLSPHAKAALERMGILK